ncbi:MAG: hypothetical protein J6584_01050 [Lactobacillus sp.]|jgi:hypothetical protein|uniref:Uncharacterized protein n=1 Tax=Bombilactobacillus bombi TaxID=1303590 RepID=A0A417ZJ47_9LACO|nr:hypothetical protein [Bombilactobacillus bombi]MCO6540908.1 hypothetical protein [Lactobacillus sp.]MCO6542555.1 hypothetical protein [Lactobacillus sp.]RHW52012.1 hypothetical protein DS831_01390 [Bombilactobacillus bombi]
MALQTKNVYLAGTRQTPNNVIMRLTNWVNLKFMGDTPITSKQLLLILTALPVIFFAGLLATTFFLLL